MSVGKWRITTLQQGLGSAYADWFELYQRIGGGHPMLHPDYVDSLMRHYGRGNEVLATLEDADGVAGLLLLRRQGPASWCSFMPAQTQLGPTLLRHVNQASGLCRALPGWVQRVDLLNVDTALCEGPEPDDGNAEASPGALTIAQPLDGPFDAYWALRPAKLRQRVRSLGQHASVEIGELRLEVHESKDAVVDAVRRYAVLESAGWKGREGTALVPGGAQEAFYLDLLARFASRDESLVLELWLGDRLAAARLLLRSGTMLATLKTAFDESLRDYAPGRLMLHQLLRHAFEREPGKRIEFCTDAHPEQLPWADCQRQILHWSIPRNWSSGFAHRQLRVLRNVLKRSSTQELSVEWLPSVDALPKKALLLLQEAESNHLETGPMWYRNLQQTVFGGADNVIYAVLNLDGAVVGVLPLQAIRGTWGWRIRALTNFYSAQYTPVIRPWVKPVQLRALFQSLRERYSPLLAVDFAPLDPTQGAVRSLQAAMIQEGFAVFPYYCFRNWYLPVSGEKPDYFSSLRGMLRSTVSRMRRRLEKAGAKIEVLHLPSDSERGIQAFEAVYRTSWKAPEPFVGFMPGLIRSCAERGWMRLGLVWLGQRPIAAQFWMVANGRAEIFKLAYDRSQRNFSPGTVLSAAMFDHVLQQDHCKEIDYLTGDDAYKRDWMTHSRNRYGLIAFNARSWIGNGMAVREALGRIIKHWCGSDRASQSDS